MIVETRYHVLALNPSEQVTLRSLLFNTYAGWVDKHLKEGYDRSPQEREQIASYTFNLFRRYNDIIDLLVSSENMKGAKPVCLILSKEGMKFIEIAVKGFDEKRNYLNQKNIEQVKRNFDKVKARALESAGFDYSKKEVDEAQGKK